MLIGHFHLFAGNFATGKLGSPPVRIHDKFRRTRSRSERGSGFAQAGESGGTVFRRRACITLALVASVLVVGTLPAHAGARTAQSKSYSSNGKSGSVVRYIDDNG